MLFKGDYRLITIENCRNVEIESARIQSLTIRNSQVVLNNCQVNSAGKALLIQNSDIQMNGCTISGTPAIEFSGTQIDIAGSKITSNGAALKNTDVAPSGQRPRPGSLPDFGQDESRLIFSVSFINSKYHEQYLQGPVNILPEQAW